MSEAEAAALLDPRGCLTPRGLQALLGAPPGQAPAELAAHLASCARCQERLLRAGAEAAAPRPRTRSPWGNLLVVTVAILLALAFLTITLVTLSGR